MKRTTYMILPLAFGVLFQGAIHSALAETWTTVPEGVLPDIRRDRPARPPKDLGSIPQIIAYEHQDYSASPEASRDLYVMNSDGTGKTKIPSYGGGGLVTRLDPALSPDGSRIAFASNAIGASVNTATGIYTMKLDGSGLVRLTQGGRQPTWSPDMSRIAFNWGDGIYVMNADGSAIHRLSAELGAKWPAWSPDGSRLLYWVPSGIIYAHNFAGQGPSQRTVVAFTPSATFYIPGFRAAWSPDGSKVAFTNTGNCIAVANADGKGSPIALTAKGLNDNSKDRKPSWSPDGRRVVFERFDYATGLPFGVTNIFVVDAIGGLASIRSERQLTTGPYNGAPSWTVQEATQNIGVGTP